MVMRVINSSVRTIEQWELAMFRATGEVRGRSAAEVVKEPLTYLPCASCLSLSVLAYLQYVHHTMQTLSAIDKNVIYF